MNQGSAVDIIFTGIDHLSGSVDQINNKLNSIGKTAEGIGSKLGAVGSLIRGVFLGVGLAAFNGLMRGIDGLARAIPDLINRGEAWASTVKTVADETGLAADKASILAAQAHVLGVPIESLTTLFARFTQNIQPQSKLLNALGISITDVNGKTRDAASIFYDVQRALAGTNDAVDKATILSKLFGRNWKDAADLLQASPDVLQQIAAQAQASGQVLSQSGLEATTAWERARATLSGTLNGLGAQIFTSLAPTLTGLINSITGVITANMGQIVTFVNEVVGYIVGVINGLFGLNIQISNFTPTAQSASSSGLDLGKVLKNLGSSAAGANPHVDALQSKIKALDDRLKSLDRGEQARQFSQQRQSLLDRIAQLKRGGDGEDAYSRSIDRQTKSIDDQIAAIQKRTAAQNAEQQRQDLVNQIGQLESQLEDMKSHAVFTAGMTALQAELARQQQAAQIADQQKQISDAKQQLADHDQQEADRQKEQKLQDQRDALDAQKTAHEQQLQNQKELDDALQQLRELDHSRQVDLQRQSIEDQKANLQAQIDAIKKAQKPAADAGANLGSSIGTSISAQVAKNLKGLGDDIGTQLSSADFAASIAKGLTGGTAFGQSLRDFFFGKDVVTGYDHGTTDHTPGLLDKIQGLITSLDTFWNTTLKPIWDAMNQLTQPLKDLLGPAGFAELFVLWKFGIPQMLAGFLASLGKLLLFGGGGGGTGGAGLLGKVGAWVGGLLGSSTLAGALGLVVDALPFAAIAALAIPFITTDSSKTVPQVKTPEAQNFYFPNSPVLPDGEPNPLYRGPQQSPDRQDNYTPAANPAIYAHDSTSYLQQIAQSLSPGGAFFQQHYNQTSAAQQAAADTARGADAAQNTAQSTGNTDVTTASTLAKIQAGIGITANSDLPVKKGVNPFSIDNTGFGVTNNPTLAGIQSKLAIIDGLKVDVGSPQVNVSNSPTVKAIAPNGDPLAKDGTPLPIKGVDTTNGALSILTQSGNNLDLRSQTAADINALRRNAYAAAQNTNALAGTVKGGVRVAVTSTGTGTGPGGGTCFPYETPVITPSGDIPIGEIKVGDRVWSVDPETLERVVSTVVALIPHPDGNERRLMVHLSGGKTIESTEWHKFFDPALGDWRSIKDFAVGDVVIDYASVRPVERTILYVEDLGNAPKPVYNFEVAVHHTYLVNGVLVHNAIGGTNADGALGMVRGLTELGYAGEAGDEAVAIIRNPRPIRSGAGYPGAGGLDGGRVDHGTMLIQIPLDGDVIGEVALEWQYRNGHMSTTLKGNV